LHNGKTIYHSRGSPVLNIHHELCVQAAVWHSTFHFQVFQQQKGVLGDFAIQDEQGKISQNAFLLLKNLEMKRRVPDSSLHAELMMNVQNGRAARMINRLSIMQLFVEN
jgi:hypothetical protein